MGEDYYDNKKGNVDECERDTMLFRLHIRFNDDTNY